MTHGVSEWLQQGRLYIWRYANPGRNWRGWHLTADPAGSRSVRNLLDRMNGGEPCHRTLRLERVTDEILSVPNAMRRADGPFTRVRIEYRPDLDELLMSDDGERLTMAVGKRRLRKVSAAFAEVERGGGDFSIVTSDDRKAEPWMFWWMPGINYHPGKRM